MLTDCVFWMLLQTSKKWDRFSVPNLKSNEHVLLLFFSSYHAWKTLRQSFFLKCFFQIRLSSATPCLKIFLENGATHMFCVLLMVQVCALNEEKGQIVKKTSNWIVAWFWPIHQIVSIGCNYSQCYFESVAKKSQFSLLMKRLRTSYFGGLPLPFQGSFSCIESTNVLQF